MIFILLIEKMTDFLKTLIFLSIILFSISKDKEEWKTRAIYQLMTDRFATSDDSEPECILNQYCGGTHVGLKNHLDYIKEMGFDAIWISPIVKNTEGSYHSYHTIDFYGINEHFGTEQDLFDLIEECHKNDIWVMLDVVANHIGPIGFDYRTINPFNSPEHYHDSCVITDWTNQKMVENCRLLDLPDLKHENDFVSDELLRWIDYIIKRYNIDGIRVDTVPEVPKWFWKKFSKASGVYQIGEVFNGDVNYVAGYQECLDALFNYPLSFKIKDAFGSTSEDKDKSMKLLKEHWDYARSIYKDPTVLGVFIDNHDNRRFLNEYKDRKKSLENASIFTVFFEGIPVLYYGDEQYFDGGVDPENREPLWGHYNKTSTLYIEFSKANKIRKNKKIWETKLENFDCDEDFCSFTREDILVAVTRGVECNKTVKGHKFGIGDKICNIFNTEDCIIVEADGIKLTMVGDPKVYVKEADLELLK